MNFIIFQLENRNFLIPLIIFCISYSFLSFNISEQGPHQDELDFFYSYSIVYFNLAKSGDFFNPCWNGDGKCELLSIEECEMNDHWITTHGIVKHLMVGFGIMINGEDITKSYAPQAPLCKPHNQPIPGENIPTKSELSSARFFSPILGSLSSVLVFYIGKALFNRTVGITFSIFLLFSSLWFSYNRTIMTETYIYFFMLLSLFLLLYSFQKQTKINYGLFCLSSIVFGIAFDTKAIVIIFLPLFLFIIFNRNYKETEFSIKKILEKKFIFKSFNLTIFYFILLISSIIITLPFYWIGPIEQIIFQVDSLNAYNSGMSLHLPWESDSKLHVRFLSTITVTFMPIIDTFYYLQGGHIPDSIKFANNFSSIVLSSFFLIGIGHIVSAVKNRRLNISELIIIVWITSTFLLISLMTESYSTSRFFIMVTIPMIFISSFGFYKFIKNYDSLKIKSIIFIFIISVHGITTFTYWEKLFFDSSQIWIDPILVKFQDAIVKQEVLISSIIFLIFVCFMVYKKTR